VGLSERGAPFLLISRLDQKIQQLNNSTTQQFNNSATQQLNNSTTQQINKSTIQQLLIPHINKKRIHTSMYPFDNQLKK